MFSSRGPFPPPRDSTIPKTTLAKLKVGEELLLHADEARQEKEDRRRVREAQIVSSRLVAAHADLGNQPSAHLRRGRAILDANGGRRRAVQATSTI